MMFPFSYLDSSPEVIRRTMRMSASGHKQTSEFSSSMSGFGDKADVIQRRLDVRD